VRELGGILRELYGILRYKEWKSRKEEASYAVAQHVHEGL